MIKRIFLTYCLTIFSALASSISVSQTRCEYRENPIGIETLQPRLNWIIESKARGTMQSAYQVIVSSSPELLKRERGDLWDSGKVMSDQSIQVPYAGRTLVSGQTCFWKVRVWNQADEVSGWSRPARWTMGLLKESDWQARWIGFTPPPERVRDTLNRLLTLHSNVWVWANGAIPGNQPTGTVYFRKEIELPANEEVAEARFLFTADDNLQLFVNGQPAGSDHGKWEQLTTRDIALWLRPGTNILGIKAKNIGKKENPAGLVGQLAIVFRNGDAIAVPIDRSWLTSRTKAEGWSMQGFDASDWKPAAELVRFGDPTWKDIPQYVFAPSPYFRKQFEIRKSVRRATVFASALGAYELHLNGKSVDRDVLSPGWTDFNKRVHYLGYDVTSQLKRGENALGAILGDGWFNSYFAFSGKRQYYGGDRRMLAQLQIDYEDGTREIIGTDESWKAAVGPIRESDLQMGCIYDATSEFSGWDKAGFDDRNWRSAEVDAGVKANLVAHPGEPIRRIEEISAKSIKEPRPGVYVFDLGQNMVGWARLELKGRTGQMVQVRYAEMLNPDGTIYTESLRRAKATDIFYLAGKSKRSYQPHFTFHGFRYVEVIGLDYKPSARDVTGVVIHSDLKRTGWFECSEPLVNKLALNSLWGQRGNFLDVPTDCPQRDERAGWTGDAQVFMKTACLNMDSAAFYTKWLSDLCSDAQMTNGAFNDVAPPLNTIKGGNVGWSDAAPICNWRMFEMYNDSRIMREHYASLAPYMDFLSRTSTNFVRGVGEYGDWLCLSGLQKSDVIGTAYYYYTARTMTDIAGVLGEQQDAEKYRQLSENIRSAFATNYIRADGRILDGTNGTGQTFYALAFGLDLVPDEMRGKVAEQFVGSIREQSNHIATGFLGTPMLLFALQKAGHPELAYQLVLNKTYPSWLQQVIWGSTTMWERWDGWRPEKGFQDPGMNSFNHYWLGCVSEWLFTQAAGIDTDGQAFKRIVIRPEIIDPKKSFNWVNARYDSIHGTIRSAWKIEGNQFHLNVTVPANCIATVFIPANSIADVTEAGRPIAKSKDTKFLRFENGRAVLEVGSGDYSFASRVEFEK